MWRCWIVFILVIVQTSSQYEGRVVCYYRSDNVYRAEGYRMQPQEIDPNLCTHVIYHSAYLHPQNAIIPSDPNLDLAKGGYKKIVKLKETNPQLKVLLSLTNDPEKRDYWPMIAAQKRTRHWFSYLTINFLRTHRFDGLDIDWQIHNSKKDSNHYLTLLQELRQQIEAESKDYVVPKLELSVILPAQIQQLHRRFQLANVSLYVDFINVATMDYWSLDPYTVQHHAPLYKNTSEGSLSPLNIDESVKYYLYKCVPPEKIVLGVPTYGRSFKLANAGMSSMGSQCKYPGDSGFATNSSGTLAYFEICTYMNEDDWNVENTRKTSMGPYAYHDDRWVGFDDIRFVSIKANYARRKNLGGLMFWTIDQDDFRGYCGEKFPLVRAGKYTLSTGNEVTDVRMLVEDESALKMKLDIGYYYPKPTVTQPDFTEHEVSFKPTKQTIPTPVVWLSSTYKPVSTTPGNSANDDTPATTFKPTVKYPTKKTTTSSTATTSLPTSTTSLPTSTTTVPTTSATTPATTVSTTTNKPSSKPSESVAEPMIDIRIPTAPSTTQPTLQTSNQNERNKLLSPQAQLPNLFVPRNPFNNLSNDTSPNNALFQLKRVLETVNQVIANVNQASGAPKGLNRTIDPSFLEIIEPLLNLRNTAQFEVQNDQPGEPSKTSIMVESDVNRFPMNNELASSPNNIFPFASDKINGSIRTENSTMPLDLSDKGLFISGRDIVSIRVNISVNNNYYGPTN